MAIAFYPAIIERAAKGYSVFFPDLPGCTSAGATMQEAGRNAEEALAAHILLSAEHGDTIPEPSDVDDIPVDPEVEEAVRLLVRVERPGRSLRVNVTLDEGLVAAIDQVAPNRSAYLAAAARHALASGVTISSGRKQAHRAAGGNIATDRPKPLSSGRKRRA
jgi:predicted RNase H-like HicB family nuclease